MSESSVSRAMWEAVERFHALTYIAPEPREEGSAAGLKGFYMNYFATRVAPVGAVGASVVQSLFFYYGPTRVERAIPDAWTFSSPEAVLAAGYRGMDQALRRTYGGRVTSPEVVEACALVREACLGGDLVGRVLFAGWSQLDWPEDPHLALWHGCTLLREHRSGSHLVALRCRRTRRLRGDCVSCCRRRCTAGLDSGRSGVDPERRSVGDRAFAGSGWLDADVQATAAGRDGRQHVEDMTDRLDLQIWRQLGQAKSRRLFDLLSELDALLPPDDQLDWEQHYAAEPLA